LPVILTKISNRGKEEGAKGRRVKGAKGKGRRVKGERLKEKGKPLDAH
jgi:hypothetical protein